MKGFHRSALGWYPGKNSVFKLEESARKKYAYNNGDWPEDLKIVYPTFKTVKQSLGGPGGGGTIFCPLDTWKKPTFPRQLFFDSRSQRDGLLQHVSSRLDFTGIESPHADIGELTDENDSGHRQACRSTSSHALLSEERREGHV
jgi:hypothetical protein